jgi:hypothetical protein
MKRIPPAVFTSPSKNKTNEIEITKRKHLKIHLEIPFCWLISPYFSEAF